jgi:hypothetical protein
MDLNVWWILKRVIGQQVHDQRPPDSSLERNQNNKRNAMLDSVECHTYRVAIEKLVVVSALSAPSWSF